MNTAESSRSEEAESKSLASRVKREALEWGRTLLIFIPVFFLVSTLLFEQRVIPSESMVPNLQVSDRVFVNKFAYGYSRFSIPWGLYDYLPLNKGRIFEGVPEHGDVVVFMHPHWRRVMIKRVIGLPGDRVQMINEQLYLNGKPVETEFMGRAKYAPHKSPVSLIARETKETIGEKSWLTHQWADRFSLDNTPVFVVPQGHFFAIGDNRDNSKDARDLSGHCPVHQGVVDQAGCHPKSSAEFASVGFVPIDHLIGRAETVLFSFYRCNPNKKEYCPPKRIWRPL